MRMRKQGYSDVDLYQRGYHPVHTPARLALAALVAGIDFPGSRGEPVSMCELGCGHGLTANIVAAVNPGITVHANDFNPAHILSARRLATEAGTPNAHFTEASFADYINDSSLPEQFDIIVLHGIYSWVTPIVRGDIIAFLRRRLRAGGIVYINYNAMPGWSAITPLHELLLDADPGEGPPAERVTRALSLVEVLRAADAAYLTVNPGALSYLDSIKGEDPMYVLQDFMGPAWSPLSFADMVRGMSEAKLTFAGSCNLIRACTAAHFNESELALLNLADSTESRESLHDLLVNETFRLDLFVRGRLPLEHQEIKRRWREFRFVAHWPLTETPASFWTHRGPRPLDPDLHRGVLDTLAGRPMSFGDLIANERLAAYDEEAVRRALLLLVHKHCVSPCLSIGDEAAAQRGAQAFNAVAGRLAASAAAVPLASPVTGGAIIAGRFNMLFHAAHTAGHPDPVAFSLAAFEAEGTPDMADDGSIKDAAEARTDATMRFERFERECCPYFRSVGIL